MTRAVRVVRGKVVVEGPLSDADARLLVEKHRTKTVFEFWRTRLASTAFLTELPALQSLSLVNTTVEDMSALAAIPTLTKLFLNETRFSGGWGFLADLAQIQELSILNIRGELVLPDLNRLDQLTSILVWGCKGLQAVSALAAVPQLKEVEFVDTGLTPDDLLPLLKKSSIAYMSSTFRTKSDNDQFQAYLSEYGKSAFREGA